MKRKMPAAAWILAALVLGIIVGYMQRIADDETVLALMPRMSQVWARKLVASASGS